MRRTELLQEIRKMRVEEAYRGWTERRLRQEEAARWLGVCERTFRRYLDRDEDEGLDGLIDPRLSQGSHRRAPVDEVMALTERYRSRHAGWNVKPFYAWYRRAGGLRSYTWVKNTLQEAGLVGTVKPRGKHRKRRQRAPLPGLLGHPDASRHEWGEGQQWDLVVTREDAINAHDSMFCGAEEGTASSCRGVRETLLDHGRFSALDTDRGSHSWLTPEAGGTVDQGSLTQFGRAMKHLGIERIPAYSPEARGRSERAFGTHPGRWPQDLAAAGITTLEAANRYLAEIYRPAFNAEFAPPAREEGNAFVPWIGGSLDDILCEQFERTGGHDNGVRVESQVLQIPVDRHRCYDLKAKVRGHRYLDGPPGSLSWPTPTGRLHGARSPDWA